MRDIINKIKNMPVLQCLLATALWGSLYPCIKIAYGEFGIDSTSIPNLLLFAGIEFSICGLIICIFYLFRENGFKQLAHAYKKFPYHMIATMIIGLVLHYSFTYIGLSMVDGGKTALLKNLAVVLFICSSSVFIKNDKFTVGKLLGAIFGITGIIVMNADSLHISFDLGSILILAASFCTVISSIISKKIIKHLDPITITGTNQFIGGIVMLVIGVTMGGKIDTITVEGIFVFAYACIASLSAYCIWNVYLKKTDLSKMFILKFMEPLFAALFSFIILQEDVLNIKYLIAILCTILAIKVSSFEKVNKNEKD